MKMTRFYFTFVLLIVTVTSNFCQNNWREGFVIQTNNDTIVGYIDDRGSKSNTKTCFFKETVEGQTLKYDPHEIYGYRIIGGKFYIAKEIQNDELKELVFLEFLVKGEVNMYHLKTDMDRYFIEKDTVIYELKNTTEVVTVSQKKDGRTEGKDYDVEYVKESNEYVGTLNYLMQDANISSEIFNSSFNTNSLIKISKKYHEAVCDDEQCIIYEKSARKGTVRFGVHVGLSMNSFNFGNSLKTEYGVGELLGFRLEYNNSFDWMERINFHLDFTFQRFSEYRFYPANDVVRITYENTDYLLGDPYYNAPYAYLDVDIKTTALKVPLTINYLFLNGKFKPYGGLGITNVFILSQNDEFIYANYYEYYGQSIPFYHLGLIGKIGCSQTLKNGSIYFDLMYEYTGTTGPGVFFLKNNIFSFNVGYAF